MTECIVCGETGGTLTLLTSKGKESIANFAKLKNDEIVLVKTEKTGDQHIHKDCQKMFTDRRKINQDFNKHKHSKVTEPSVGKTTRGSNTLFWKTKCFFCKQKLTKNSKLFYSVKSPKFRDTLIRECESRIAMCSNDTWANEIKSHLSTCFDLVSVGARYHNMCKKRFSNGQTQEERCQAGRPKKGSEYLAFEEACSWLEKETEFHTVSEFVKKVEELSETGETYSRKWIQQLLSEKYGEYVLVSSVSEGKENIITFKNSVQFLIEEKYKSD